MLYEQNQSSQSENNAAQTQELLEEEIDAFERKARQYTTLIRIFTFLEEEALIKKARQKRKLKQMIPYPF